MGINRALRRGRAAGPTDADIGQAAKRIYDLLWNGHYTSKTTGCQVSVQGDLSKLTDIEGLRETELALIRNYQFMCTRLAGTRQARRCINHMILQ